MRIVAFAFLVACADGSGGKKGGADDTSTLPTDDTGTVPCAEVAVLTWDNFGHGFLLENCWSCHHSEVTGDDRHDAPESVTFDTKEQAWALHGDILDEATGEAPTMPPQGGPSDDDRTRLLWWLTCGVEGT